jgi:predicted Rossmann-fold nucleotide-binding protein
MKRRVIVGIMGGDEQPREAAALGSWVAAAGHILLTGGRPIDDVAAKNAAMFGAVSQLRGERTARLIGILPSSTIEWSTPKKHQLFLSTGLGGIERDPLNGMTPDIVVVLRGGTGTLLEMTYASASEKPVIFLDSSNALGKKVEVHRRDGKLQNCLLTALKYYPLVRGKLLSANDLNRILDEALVNAREMRADDLSVLSNAVSRLPTELQPSGFSGIPQNDEVTIRRFNEIVTKISAEE